MIQESLRKHSGILRSFSTQQTFETEIDLNRCKLCFVWMLSDKKLLFKLAKQDSITENMRDWYEID